MLGCLFLMVFMQKHSRSKRRRNKSNAFSSRVGQFEIEKDGDHQLEANRKRMEESKRFTSLYVQKAVAEGEAQEVHRPTRKLRSG